MAGKRPVKKGSFGSHFDELVKLFPHEPASRPHDSAERPPADDKHDIHDRLFERAWRKH